MSERLKVGVPAYRGDVSRSGKAGSMTLAQQLRASVEMERYHNAHDRECAALVSLAKSQSKWAVRYSREGLVAEAVKYRSNAWWHLEKARQKRDLANAIRARRLRVVAA